MRQAYFRHGHSPPATVRGMSKRTTTRISQDKVDAIVRARLAGRPLRDIASEVGVAYNTARRAWDLWLDETAQRYTEELDRERARIIARLSRIADDAARAADMAEKDADRARFMAEERQALAQLGRILGIEVAKVEHSGDGFTVVRIVEERPTEVE